MPRTPVPRIAAVYLFLQNIYRTFIPNNAQFAEVEPVQDKKSIHAQACQPPSFCRDARFIPPTAPTRRPSFACVLARAPCMPRKFALILGEFSTAAEAAPRPAVQRTADGGLRAQPPRRPRRPRRPGAAAAPRTGSPLHAQHLAVHCLPSHPASSRPVGPAPFRRAAGRGRGRRPRGRVRRPVAGGRPAIRARWRPPPAAAPSHACEGGHGIYRPEADRRRR